MINSKEFDEYIDEGVRMEEEISLRELIEILWAGKGIIITLTVIALIVSGVVNFFVIKPTYQAKTVLAVNQPEGFESSENSD